MMGGLGFNAQRQDVGNKVKVTPHINESDQVRLEIEQESSAAGTPTGALGAIPITKRTANTTVVVKDQQTVVIGGLMQDSETTSRDKVPLLGDIPVLGFLFSSTKHETKKSNLLLILTPHVIREQEDLRRIFERKMQERQEFIDRYFVFATDQWEPPTDYTRANGLVEDIRQAYFEIEEAARLEQELRPRELHEHVPGEPVDLPSGVKEGGGRPGGARPPAPTPAPTPPPQRGELRRDGLPEPGPLLHPSVRPESELDGRFAASL
jgi:general secretion pathway protein D